MKRRIGILGGGQLGRMLYQPSIDLDLDINFMDADPESPCSKFRENFTEGLITDYAAVMAFGADKDVLSIEIENVNTEALTDLEKQGKKVFPQPHIIRLIQDKREQKLFYKKHSIPTAEFVLTESKDDLFKHRDFLPAFHKLGREGYDGRGVQRILSEQDIPKGFDKPGLLEKLVEFEKELAVIVAVAPDLTVKTFPVVEMVFHPEHNLVSYLLAPARISDPQAAEADAIARKVASELGIIGLLAVEMFLTRDGAILVNEIAPRPHNSGHHTIEANITSQYEQLLRILSGMPLGDTDAIMPAAMLNLLGEEGHTGVVHYEGLESALAIPGVFVHLYGKKYTKPFRKMGHVTIIGSTYKLIEKKLPQIEGKLKVISHL